MTTLSNRQMIEEAGKVLHPRQLTHDNTAGDVACALQSASGKLYYGVCIDVGSGMGFCAEHSAIAAMVTAGESRIAKIVAIWGDASGRPVVLPPCGRCREFMHQIDSSNLGATEVVLSETSSVTLSELLPHPYNEVWQD